MYHSWVDRRGPKSGPTRLTLGELAEVELAAERAGKPLSEWLREMALTAARERRSNPIELLLAEVLAMRYKCATASKTGTRG